jgi:ribulose-5-phosphate 4-epimerase/fuculose-1-phosphate aldolase
VVLHLHAPYSTALRAIQGGRLQMIHQNAARIFGDIAYDDHFNGSAEAVARSAGSAIEVDPAHTISCQGMLREQYRVCVATVSVLMPRALH